MAGSISVMTIVGARPQFVKAAAVSRAIARHNAAPDCPCPLSESIVHTGQHYDSNMSQVFFDELEIPSPRHHLGVGSGSHGRQTAAMLERIESVLMSERPDRVLVYGDTNSTLAGALAAAKLGIPIAHVEGGLRSFDKSMPEEVNRVVTDHLSDLLFCPTQASVRNLAREGITTGVHQVGDVMHDSVLFHVAHAERTSRIREQLGLSAKQYFLATVHRACNTDDPAKLNAILSALSALPLPVVLPLHPRTRQIMNDRGITASGAVRITEPLPYHDILALEKNARAIMTDSGGMQKEAYFFRVPCITLREETEWVELVAAGANRLAGSDAARIAEAVEWAMSWRPALTSAADVYGDGSAASRIVEILTSESFARASGTKSENHQSRGDQSATATPRPCMTEGLR
ncbi:MAG: UDP-N-acetylglucosamine 2-epimerase (non-hydrolyzing) [Phycisphaerae bacterium]|nr:UDP-N-acetylglucosamine 2-epimerase (non-hydrolyzing) [Phycisphaerae bacterium]